jgi:hypothetical protein
MDAHRNRAKQYTVGSGRWTAQLERRGQLVTLRQGEQKVTLPQHAFFQIAYGLGEIVTPQ